MRGAKSIMLLVAVVCGSSCAKLDEARVNCCVVPAAFVGDWFHHSVTCPAESNYTGKASSSLQGY